MIRHLTLRNFKAWQELDMAFGRVTAIFGANSSGKSTILQFFHMLKRTRDNNDPGIVMDLGGPQADYDLGSYRDVVFGRDINKKIMWKIVFSPYDPIENDLGDSFRPIVLELEVTAAFGEVGIFIESASYHNSLCPYAVMVPPFNFIDKFGNQKRIAIAGVDGKNIEKAIYLNKGYALIDGGLHAGEILGAMNYFDDCSGIAVRIYEEIFDESYFIGPIRDFPSRHYYWIGATPWHVGFGGDSAIPAILAATVAKRTVLLDGEERPFQDAVARLLKRLGLVAAFSIDEVAPGTQLYRAMVQPRDGATPVQLTDVGFGVSQVLPVIVQLLYAPEGSILFLEQPELHLHPAVQSQLAEVIMDVAQQRNLQIIVESHSEHMLMRFQRWVAEEKFPVQDLKTYFVTADAEGAHLQDLKMNEFGEIENWPEDFFGDAFGEIASIQEAALNRRLAAS